MCVSGPSRSPEEEAEDTQGGRFAVYAKAARRGACQRFAVVAPARRQCLRRGLTPHRSMGRKRRWAASGHAGAREACEGRGDGAAARRRWCGNFARGTAGRAGRPRPGGRGRKEVRRPAWAQALFEARLGSARLGSRLGSARLGSARLGSARLGSARLGSARLGSARLGSARLGSARLGSARLGSARLGSARLGSARLGSARLGSARLGSARLGSARLGSARLGSARLGSARLGSARLGSARLGSARLGSARLGSARLGSARLGSARLGSARLGSARLGSARLGSARLGSARLGSARLGSARLGSARLGSARLGSARLGSARLGSARLGSARLGSARLGSARLGSARLGSARLGSARLGSARLGSARLGSARLGSARLGSARLGSARLGSARLGSARLGSARLGSSLYLPPLQGQTPENSETLLHHSLELPAWLTPRRSRAMRSRARSGRWPRPARAKPNVSRGAERERHPFAVGPRAEPAAGANLAPIPAQDEGAEERPRRRAPPELRQMDAGRPPQAERPVVRERLHEAERMVTLPVEPSARPARALRECRRRGPPRPRAAAGQGRNFAGPMHPSHNAPSFWRSQGITLTGKDIGLQE